jgi:hypothetical protein
MTENVGIFKNFYFRHPLKHNFMGLIESGITIL